MDEKSAEVMASTFVEVHDTRSRTSKGNPLARELAKGLGAVQRIKSGQKQSVQVEENRQGIP